MHKVKHCDHKPISARVEPPRDTVVVPPGHQPVTRLTPTAALVGVTRDKLHLSGNMKRILRKIRDKIKFKEDLPPPYQENESPGNIHREERFADVHFTENSTPYEALDLLANCHITRRTEDLSDSEVEYAEIEEMGLWHSTPLSQRHKSKISLTWVLKENLESTKHQPTHHEERIKSAVSDVDRYQRHNQKFSDKDRQRKCDRQKPRVVGRNEYYHNMKFKSACEPVNQESCSEDYSVGTEECRRKHRHRHRRKKRHRQSGRFGYDIRDLDCFLSEASIDRPGNIPVVVAYPTVLYQTHSGNQQELTLPLGTVVNAVFKNKQWLYTQTPHGEEGYVMYNACLPLGILPNRTFPQKKTPCWESSTDIYPRPCGNLTDTEKEKLRGRTRSETRNRTNTSEKRRTTKSCAEEDFDTLYLKTKSVCSNIEKTYDKVKKVQKSVKRQMLLVVNSDFEGSSYNRTLSVRQGEVVVLVQGRGESDVDADWFYVRKRDGSQGFIPAVVAGHGYI